MSPTAAQQALAAKAKRQKQFVAVGSVVLLAIVGFELTHFLGGGGSPTTSGLTTPVVSVDGSAAAPAAKLPDTDRVVIQRDSDQLLSFGMFKSKDPFVQQLSATSATPSGTVGGTSSGGGSPAPTAIGLPGSAPPAAPSGSATTPGGSGATPAPPSGTAPSGTTPGSSPASPTTPATPANTALISTNGVCQSVSVNGTFPNGQNVFRLISIAKDGKSVQIAVVGGSYDSGQPAATLKLGGKLTLVNTADGTRYVISLMAKCAVVQPSRPAGTTTSSTPAGSAPAPATTTPQAAPPAPTTTATTPIVTDSLDTTTATTTTTPTS